MVEKVQVLGRTGRNSLQKSTTFNVSGKRQSQFQRLNYSPTVPSPVSIDSNFKYNTLLIHADGISGANNTVFLDSSSSAYVPFPKTYSNYFNGSTDYISIPNNTAFDQNVPFTLECWVYRISGSAASGYIYAQLTSGYLTLLFNTSNQFQVDKSFVGVQTTSSSTFAYNTWHHVAMCYDGTNTRLFVNGTLQGSFAGGGAASATTTTIGAYLTGSNYFPGYISNLRVVRGTALYTSTFTPPTTQLTAVTNTQLLTCQSPRFIDNSTNNLTITQNGTLAISAGGPAVSIGAGKPFQGTFSPFSGLSGYSVYFPGSSSNYISLAADGNNTIGTRDFTMECWFNTSTGGSATNAATVPLVVSHQTGGMFAIDFGVGGTGYLRAAFNQDAGVSDTKVGPSTNFGISNNTWYHVAVTRVGQLLTLYLNGNAVGTYTLAAGTNIGSFGGAKPIYIGAGPDLGSWYTGYIADFRFVIGTALYTSNFTPPTSQPSATVTGTRILICGSANGYLNYSDLSKVYTAAITANGTIPVTSFGPFVPAGAYDTLNNGSIYFSGTSDYIRIPQNITTGTANYTLEGWIYPLSVSALETAVVKLIGTSSQIEVRIASSKLTGQINGSSPTAVGGNTTIFPNRWYHFALVKNNNVATLYINGVAESTTAADNTNYDVTTNFTIGGNQTGGSLFNGWISNVKYTIGKAIYTANFTPPLTSYNNSDAPILLLNATNASIIDQTGKNVFTTYGAAAISSTQSKFGGTSIYLDGSTAAIAAPYISNYHSFHLSDYTVELWVYPLSYTGMSRDAANIPTLIGGMAYNANINDWSFGMTTTGILKFYYYNGGTVSVNSSTTIPLNAWSHIAAVKTSSGISIYYNGTLVAGPTAISGTPSIQAGTFLTLGAFNTVYCNAYVDDVRISKYARYTTNFTPPTAAFADQ